MAAIPAPEQQADSPVAVLAAIREARAAADREEVRVLELAADWAAMHEIDLSSPLLFEQPARFTGKGVPEIGEFCVPELAAAGLAGRSEVLVGDARDHLTRRTGFDVALLANLVYYLPVDERALLLRRVRDGLSPGGRVIVVTTVLEDNSFSRHFDLLLRAQRGSMQLPAVDELARQIREAGFGQPRVRRVSHGEPLMAFVATAT